MNVYNLKPDKNEIIGTLPILRRLKNADSSANWKS